MENEKELNRELKLEDLKGVAGGGIGVSDLVKRPAGFHCPQCEGVVPATVEQIIAGVSVVCPHCGLHMRLTADGPVIETTE